jgi:hypothetical protein
MIDLTATVVEWRKSSRSTPTGNDCVELAVVVRSRD